MRRLDCDGLYNSLEALSQAVRETKETRSLYEECNKHFFNDGKLEDSLEVRYISNTDNVEDMVENIIQNGEFDKKLKGPANTLLSKIPSDNLYLCAMNLALNPKVIKVDKNMLGKNASGKYDNMVNSILYTDDKSINHEILHLASSPFAFNQENCRQSGFQIVFDDIPFGTGFNEGYTELLNRRYFEDEDYNTDYYTTNVYLMRMFELLYDSPKDMEKDYFSANYKGPIDVFRQYGSTEELEAFMNYLDSKAANVAKNDQEMLMMEFMGDIVSRAGNVEKVEQAEEIMNEYIELKSEKNDVKTR